MTERECERFEQHSLGGADRLRGDAHAEVVLEAADEQCEPACRHEQLAVLAEADRLAESLRPVQPGACLSAQRYGYSPHSAYTVAWSESSVPEVVSDAWIAWSRSAARHGSESRRDAVRCARQAYTPGWPTRSPTPSSRRCTGRARCSTQTATTGVRLTGCWPTSRRHLGDPSRASPC